MAPVAYPFVVDLVRERLGADGDVLEVGCGVGQYRPLLGGRYTGLDLPSSPYLEQAERQPDLLASAEAIPAADASFDVVFGVATFSQMDDPAKAFSECRRVLRPGGYLLVFDYQRGTCEEIARTADNLRQVWDFQALRELLGQAGIDPGAVRDRSHVANAGDARGLRGRVRTLKQRAGIGRGQWLVVEART
jgi:SAM-dependent methyltransferase